MQSIDVSQNRGIPMEDSHLLFDDRESCSIRPTASSPEKDVSDLSLAMVVLRGEKGKPRTLARGRDGSPKLSNQAEHPARNDCPASRKTSERSAMGHWTPPNGVGWSDDRFQDHSAVRDERHDEAQHAAQDDGRDLAELDVHPDEHEAFDRQDRGGHHSDAGCQRKTPGTISPTVQTSSRMPSAIQASRGKAPNDGTPSLTLSNMKTFMTPDAPYRNAPRTCRTHNRMFIVSPLGFFARQTATMATTQATTIVP